jgi:hypothetical protein
MYTACIRAYVIEVVVIITLTSVDLEFICMSYLRQGSFALNLLSKMSIELAV